VLDIVQKIWGPLKILFARPGVPSWGESWLRAGYGLRVTGYGFRAGYGPGEKYQDLRLEIQRMWNIKARVVSIVVGALGASSNNLEKHFQEIPGKNKIPNWQRQQYLAVHISYERCSICQSPGKTPRSKKNTYLKS